MAPGSTHHASHAGGAAAGGGGDDDGGDAAAGCERQQRLEQRTANIAGAAATILANIAGEDGGREGLQRTPERFARAWAFFTSGYAKSVRQECNGAVFAVAGADMVLVRDVDVCSLCEHHLVPFVGKIHMAYVPRGRVLGLSKLVRIVEIFARRLQVQERLTQEVAGAIDDVLGPEGVVVVAECTHMCMSMRGVQRPGATTVSQCRRGVFERDAHVYEQFSALLRKR